MKAGKIARTMGVGVVAGALYAGWRAYRARVAASEPSTAWQAAPFPFPPIPRPAPPSATPAAPADAAAVSDTEAAAPDATGAPPDFGWPPR